MRQTSTPKEGDNNNPYIDERGYYVFTKSYNLGYLYQYKDRKGNIRSLGSRKMSIWFKFRMFLAKHFLIGGTKIHINH